MSVGPNYGLNKALALAAGNGALVLGEIYTSDTAVQSGKKSTTVPALTPLFVAAENIDATKTVTGKVYGNFAVTGLVWVKLGGTVAKDAKVAPNASGLAVAQARAAAGAQPVPILGTAMDAGVSGDLIVVRLEPGASY